MNQVRRLFNAINQLGLFSAINQVRRLVHLHTLQEDRKGPVAVSWSRYLDK